MEKTHCFFVVKKSGSISKVIHNEPYPSGAALLSYRLLYIGPSFSSETLASSPEIE